MSTHSPFSEIVADGIEDMHILHVFILQAFRVDKRAPLRKLEIPDEILLADPDKWVRLPDERREVERWETERLRLETLFASDRSDRYYVAEKAKQHFASRSEPESDERQDVRWTAQALPRNRDFDELLYRLYAMNRDVFGDKATRDLYVFSLLDQPKQEVQPPGEGTPKARVRLRIYALMKQLANQRGSKTHTLFNPVIAVAAVLSPTWNETGDENGSGSSFPSMQSMLDLSLSPETAHFSWKTAMRHSTIST